MKTYDELAYQWSCCRRGGQVLVDAGHPLKLYLNYNDQGEKELLVPVDRHITQFNSTAAIRIENYSGDLQRYLGISLSEPRLETEFLNLCVNLIESSRDCKSAKEAQNALFSTLKKWYFLLASALSSILSLEEIRGLIGEVQFIIDELDNGRTAAELIGAWKVFKDASRDFIFDDTWAEVKTAESSKEYVEISSIEQLDHDHEGTLVVYKLDRDKTGQDNCFDLNDKIDELKAMLSIQDEASLDTKLLQKGYVHNTRFEEYRFRFKDKAVYTVNDSFPRIRREELPAAINRAKYELLFKGIEGWRIDG